eukprot:TRINITY_DN8814_c1_g1_i1.p1 TRINITY_DN8814_c1_g1~~TRINITY_DN8814_c1_g1_i1.p1  ORF type:complete len:243 (-),score=-23.17 TRINITY_DN8814_c1_g1_i1:25-753(-)
MLWKYITFRNPFLQYTQFLLCYINIISEYRDIILMISLVQKNNPEYLGFCLLKDQVVVERGLFSFPSSIPYKMQQVFFLVLLQIQNLQDSLEQIAIYGISQNVLEYAFTKGDKSRFLQKFTALLYENRTKFVFSQHELLPQQQMLFTQFVENLCLYEFNPTNFVFSYQYAIQQAKNRCITLWDIQWENNYIIFYDFVFLPQPSKMYTKKFLNKCSSFSHFQKSLLLKFFQTFLIYYFSKIFK